MRTDVVGCFAKLLEAAFAAGAGAPMSMSMSMSRPVPGRGGLVRHESGGHQQHHHYYFPAHPPEAPIQMVRLNFYRAMRPCRAETSYHLVHINKSLSVVCNENVR